MSGYTLTTFRTVYAPWSEGEDEPQRLHVGEESDTFDTVAELADAMDKGGAWHPSSEPTVDHRTWWSAETYEHPYSGEREDVTFHMGDDVPERLRAAVSRSLLARRDRQRRGDSQR